MRQTMKDASSVEERIFKEAHEIVSLKPEQWVEAAEKLRDRVAQSKGMGRVKEILEAAADAKFKEAERIADILRREPNLDPNGEDKVFVAFKRRRFARLFKQNPEMVEHLKTQAQATSYNKGVKLKFKLYDEIAGDADGILAGVEKMCKVDEELCGLVEGMRCTVRETIDIMDWYADNKHTAIGRIYEEYRDVPTKDMFVVQGDQSPAKSFRSKRNSLWRDPQII